MPLEDMTLKHQGYNCGLFVLSWGIDELQKSVRIKEYIILLGKKKSSKRRSVILKHFLQDIL